MNTWIDVCEKDEIDEEDVIRFDHDGKKLCIYRSPEDSFHATTTALHTRACASGGWPL